MRGLAPLLAIFVLSSPIEVSECNPILGVSKNEGNVKESSTVSPEECVDPPLHLAIRSRQIKYVETLLQQGSDLYELDCDGLSPMHVAIKSGQEVIKILLKYKFDVNRRFWQGNTVLMYAATNGLSQALHTLYRAGAHIDDANDEGLTALYQAVNTSNYDIAREMVTLGADIKKKTSSGDTYIHKATRDDNYDNVDIFLNFEVPVNEVNNKGETALTLAIRNDNPALINLLVHKGANLSWVDANGHNYMQVAVMENRTEAIRAIQENGFPSNPQNEMGRITLNKLEQSFLTKSKLDIIQIVEKLLGWF